MDQMLLVDSCSNAGFELNLTESASSRGLVKFRGKFQEAEAINKNKRMYPYDVLNESIKLLSESIKGRGLVGELDHPTDSIIHFSNASHAITKLWWDGNILMGEGEILDTPSGQVLKALLNNGVRVGISSRGVGNGKVNEDGVLVIGESYKLITFDAVADPSCYEAFQEKIVSKKESVVHFPVKEQSKNHNYSEKNENNSINMINKEALIASLGGFAKSQFEILKSRLNNG